MRQLLLLVIAGMLFLPAQAQNPPHRASTTISIGAGGPNPLLGLNVDQLFLRRPEYNLSFRVGIPLYNPFTQATFPEMRGKGVSTGFNFLYGMRNVHLETGLSAGLFQATYYDHHQALDGSTKTLSMNIALRYQRSGGGFFMKAGLSPMVTSFRLDKNYIRYSVIPQLEMGFTLPNRYQNPADVEFRARREEFLRSRKPFHKSLDLVFLAGYEVSGYESGQMNRATSATGRTSAGLNPSGVAPGFLPGVEINWQFARHFALSSGIDFRRERMRVNWYASYFTHPSNSIKSTARGYLFLDLYNLRVPVYGKFTLGDRLKVGFLAGPYLNVQLSRSADGNSVLNVANFPASDLSVEDENVDQLPLVGAGLAPARLRWGLSAGFELHYRLNEQHGLLLRATAGRDVSMTFHLPEFRVIMANVQAGYSFRLK